MKPKISFCLITRNNQNYLENCLKSIKLLAWEIIIIDLSSTDHTVKIAKKYGTVFHTKLVNDFSLLRNMAIKKAKGDWIFFIEPEEVLSKETQNQLFNFLTEKSGKKEEIYALKFFFIQPKGYSQNVSFKPVLFPNNERFRFSGSVFEYPVYDNNYLPAKRIHSLTIFNFENQKPAEETKNKVISDLKKLITLLEKNNTDFYYFYQLGNCHNRLGDFYKALEAYRQGYRIYQEKKDQRLDFYGELLLKMSGTLVYCTDQYIESLKFSKELLALMPEFPDAIFLKGLSEQNLGNFGQALSDYELLLEKIKKPLEKINPLGLTSLEKAIIPRVLLEMGKSFLALGNKERGLLFLKQAQENDPDLPEINLHLIRYYLLEDLLPPMLECYFKNTGQNYTDKEKQQMKEVANLPAFNLAYRKLQLKFLRSLEQTGLWSNDERKTISDKITAVSNNIL